MQNDEQRLEVELQPTADAPSIARGLVRDALQGTELLQLLGDAQLVTSELVTNVTQHADGPVRLTIVVDARQMRVEVKDQTNAGPIVNTAPDSQGGFGLQVVKALSSRWGVEFETDDGSGKTVWSELHL